MFSGPHTSVCMSAKRSLALSPFPVNGDFVIFQVLWAVSLPVSGLTAMEAGACLCYASTRPQNSNSGSGFGNFLSFPFITLFGWPFVMSLSISDHQNGLPFLTSSSAQQFLTWRAVQEEICPYQSY